MKKWIPGLALILAGGMALAQTLTLWTTETQPIRMKTQQKIAQQFEQQTGIKVNVVPVEENNLQERVTAAFAAGQLPDLIFHPIDYTLGWAAAGILDTQAANDVVNTLGRSTFVKGALELATYKGQVAAVPTDGWVQLLLYRKDLFDKYGLKAPTTYAAVLAAVNKLGDPPGMYGFVAATDPSQVYFQQVFEWIAMANGARLVGKDGKVDLNTPQMIGALKFYKQLAKASPPGNLYWQQSRELYFAGKAAQIIWSPFIMDELANLRNSVPVTAFGPNTGDRLAKDTGFVSNLSGPDDPRGSGYAQISYMGITVDAHTQAAEKFVEYLMNQGYLEWLSMAPEGKFPVRKGVPGNPEKFVDGWAKLPIGVDRKAPLGRFYSPAVIQEIYKGLENADRWGFREGKGQLVSAIYGSKVIPKIVSSYLDGEITAEQAAAQMQQQVVALGQ